LLDRPDKKDTDIKVLAYSELPKIKTDQINLPKPIHIKTRTEIEIEK
jgi:hypothetical protein